MAANEDGENGKPPAERPGSKSGTNSVDADRGDVGEKFGRVIIPPQLENPRARQAWGLPPDPEVPASYIVELNILHASGLDGAAHSFIELYEDVIEGGVAAAERRGGPRRVGKTYFAVFLPLPRLKKLVIEDGIRAASLAELQKKRKKKSQKEPDERRHRAIYRVWPDFKIKGLVDASAATIKADAAFRAFAAAGSGIVWAVIDSGVQGNHPHFAGSGEMTARGGTLAGPCEELHRCFCEVLVTTKDGGQMLERLPDPDRSSRLNVRRTSFRERRALIRRHREHALRDEFGHGTHVAGIIAGGLGKQVRAEDVVRLERRASVEPDDAVQRKVAQVDVHDPTALRGVAPGCRLVSLRVLDHNGEGLTSDVIRALEYIRESLNDDPKLLRVHGVNLSVGYEFDAEMFACGQSPICAEVDRLVRAGVVVVAAAGNTGYGTALSDVRQTKVCLSNTINDPGNAELAITVGATHRDSPHTYGVSYFSSKGPTGDGRLKPDLVAPGERITSCGAGRTLQKALTNVEEGGLEPQQSSANGVAPKATATRAKAYYLEDSGTSMAAPHVSGAIAAFLSIRREFVSKPMEVKRLFLDSATPLGRERYFEGHGLVDLMRAIQSV